MLDTQRLCKVLLLVLIESEAGEFLDRRAQHNEVDVAVAELHSGSGNGNSSECAAQSLLLAFPRVLERTSGGRPE